MKKIVLLLIAPFLISGCAAGIIAGAAAMDQQNSLETARLQCLNQYGFLVNARYEWIETNQNPHQVVQQEYVFKELYVERVAKGSFAAKQNIEKGDVIVSVDGERVNDVYGISRKYADGGYHINTITFKNSSGITFIVPFESN